MDHFDVVILGAGTGGQTAAHDLAAEGYSVAVVETSSTPGGVCALHGCQAKKWLYEVAKMVAQANHLKGLGVPVPPQANWGEIIEAKNKFTSKVPENTVSSLKGNNVRYIEGKGSIQDPNTVRIDEKSVSTDFIIIATGATPAQLPIDGGEHIITSNEFLALKTIPKKIVFIGGGFISFEFAHFAARLGADPGEVHILEATDKVLGPFDQEMVKQLVAASQDDGIRVSTAVTITAVEPTSNGLKVHLKDGSSIETNLVVNGTGRIANIDDLNLEAVGVKFSKRGIEVNERMQTSVENIYAVGDCAQTIQLARVADKEAHTAAMNIVAVKEDDKRHLIDYSYTPAVLFTYPQLAMVGKTEDELKKENGRYWRSFDTELSWPTYKRVGMRHAGYKILVDENDLILGAHILSDYATGLINTIRQAMIYKVPVQELHARNIMTPYPSRESDIIYMLSSLLD